MAVSRVGQILILAALAGVGWLLFRAQWKEMLGQYAARLLGVVGVVVVAAIVSSAAGWNLLVVVLGIAAALLLGGVAVEARTRHKRH